MLTFSKRIVSLARSSGALVGVPFITADRTDEQANAFTLFNAACVKANADPAAAYAFAAQPDTGRTPLDIAAKAARVAKPAPEAPKPEPKPEAAAKPDKPTKPADTSKADAYAERVNLVNKLRDDIASFYNGPSPAVRSNPKRVASSVYSDLFANPKHKTTLDRISVRDESALALILKHGGKAGSFDPVHLNFDAGIFSRLASVGFIAADGNSGVYILTPAALTHARGVVKRAKAA